MRHFVNILIVAAMSASSVFASPVAASNRKLEGLSLILTSPEKSVSGDEVTFIGGGLQDMGGRKVILTRRIGKKGSWVKVGSALIAPDSTYTLRGASAGKRTNYWRAHSKLTGERYNSPIVKTPVLARATGPYSDAGITMIDASGWQYRFEPNFHAITAQFEVYLTESPPGEARLRMSYSTPKSFAWSMVGATPDRTPPRRSVGVEVFWGLDGYDYFTDWGGVSKPECDFTYYSVAAPPQEETMLECALVSGANGAHQTSEDGNESEVAATAAALTATKPVIAVQFTPACYVYFTPDGETIEDNWANPGICDLTVDSS